MIYQSDAARFEDGPGTRIELKKGNMNSIEVAVGFLSAFLLAGFPILLSRAKTKVETATAAE